MTTIEAALSGGVILVARDGAYRDMASMHGSYRKVVETLPALELLGTELAESAGCRMHLVSRSTGFQQRTVENNDGRTGSLKKAWQWRIELVPNPDALLAESSEIVATADSVILDRCSVVQSGPDGNCPTCSRKPGFSIFHSKNRLFAIFHSPL